LRAAAIAAVALTALLSACTSSHSAAPPSSTPSTESTTVVSPTAAQPSTAGVSVPRWDHIVVVVLENKPYGELVGTSGTPFLTSLAAKGTVLTESYAITHPSEPNYLALFAGTTEGLSSDSCPRQFTGPNLATSLIDAGFTFTGYSESLPSPGFAGCSSGSYARKHNPWVDFSAVPTAVNQPFTSFPQDFTQLPSVSFVIPNLDDDMHDGTIAQGDHWLAAHLAGYASWTVAHNSLLIITTDEDDNGHSNHITTLVDGAHVPSGIDPTRVTHYNLLRTLLTSFGLSPFAGASGAQPITGIWSA
jgi:hypothetical protein